MRGYVITPTLGAASEKGSIRPPHKEKQEWIHCLKEAHAEMDGDREGRDRASSRRNAQESVAFQKQYLNHKLKVKKGKVDDVLEPLTFFLIAFGKTYPSDLRELVEPLSS